MVRDKLLVGNMKMNQTLADVDTWVSTAMESGSAYFQQTKTIICPQTCLINSYNKALTSVGSAIGLGGQWCSWRGNGQFTGQNSVDALMSVGAELVIVGEREEREYLADDNTLFADKISYANAQNIPYILYCVGEDLDERVAGLTTQVLTEQLTTGLYGVPIASTNSKLIVCYEPVWAIGTGETITFEQAEEACAYIRNIIESLSNEEAASQITILFGGSVNVRNAQDLISMPNIDGFLAGGISLKPVDFAQIANIMSKA